MTPTQFLAILRDSHPDMVRYNLNGGCWELFCILRRVYPQARPYHTYKGEISGHVATEIDGVLYDIRGRIKKPSLYEKMTLTTSPSLRNGYALHRWVRGEKKRVQSILK